MTILDKLFPARVAKREAEAEAKRLAAAEAAAAGLPEWNPVFPAQPKGWHDEDHDRKVNIEQRIADE